MISEPAPSRVLIAIQARSNSSRFPGKIFEEIGRKMVLSHVIDAAKSAKIYVERAGKVHCDVAILHPEGDTKIIEKFKNSGVLLISGPEHDVLTRYVSAQRLTLADYVVRLTSDCPLVFDFIISKHINVAVYNKLDYVSNVEESCRQIADGFDCEIMSANAIEWLAENAKTAEEREHVTLALRTRDSRALSQGFVSSKMDTSDMKLSLDTKEDLDRIRSFYHRREHKMDNAILRFGRKRVYEL